MKTEITIEREQKTVPLQNPRIIIGLKDPVPKPMLSIVLPAYNEAESIRGVVLEYFGEIVTKLHSRLIVAEDGSVDQTPEILAGLAAQVPITLLSDRNRKGYAKGVADALKACKEDWVFFSDSDGQYFSSDFWQLWENRQGYDMIVGRKTHRDEGIHRIILSKTFHTLFNSLFGLRLHDADCGFRLIRREVIESVVDKTKTLTYSFWAEFTIRACLKNFRVLEFPINHANRMNGGTRIYATSKIPMIVLKQLKGLAYLYKEIRKG
jgi:glycosyltransferase involved in cell wall biosynthesis